VLRIAAAVTTGAIALSIAQPTDLVKIRMQSTRRRYDGCLHAYRTIVSEERVRGLWKGLSTCLSLVPTLVSIAVTSLDSSLRLIHTATADAAVLSHRVWRCERGITRKVSALV